MGKGKIILFGYYGFGNLGDELFIEYFIDLIKQRFSAHRLIVLVNNPREYEPRDGVEYVSRWNFRRLFKLFKKGDLLIGGGGSIFQDLTGKKSLLYYLTLLRLAQLKKTRVILAGQGFGPLSPWGERLTAKVLNKVDVISCRDPASVKYLFQIKVYRAEIYLGVDPLWGLKGLDSPPACDLRAWADPQITDSSRAIIGLFLRHAKEEKGRYHELKDELRSLLQLNFMGVLTLALAPVDRYLCAGGIRGSTVQTDDGSSVLYHPTSFYLSSAGEIGSLAQMTLVCKGLSLVIGERLHGLLLAARLGIPGIGLGGDPKIKSFCREMGYPCFTWEELNYEATLHGLFLDEVKKAVKNLSSEKQRLAKKVAEMEKKARKDRIWLVRRITEQVARA